MPLKIQLLFLSFVLSSLAQATLGDRPNINSSFHGKARKQSQAIKAQYTEHVTEFEGISVKEYENTQGKVFAVLWRGPVKPDLEALLGSYNSEFQEADQKQRRADRDQMKKFVALKNEVGVENAKKSVKIGLRSKSYGSVKSQNIVVQRSGHMRDLKGMAYIPSLVPAGFDLGDLKW